MAKQRMINTVFWRDEYVIDLDPLEKLIFLYALSCPDSNLSGIYRIPLKVFAADTGIDGDMIMKIMARFEESGKMKYNGCWLALKNFIWHQKMSPNVVKSIIENIKEAPREMVDWVFDGITQTHVDDYEHLIIAIKGLGYKIRIENESAKEIDNSQTVNENQIVDHERMVYLKQFDDMAVDFYEDLKKYVDPPSWKNRSPNLSKWASDFEKVHRLNGRPIDEINFVRKWVVRHSFWQSNILSANSFREKYDRLCLQMKKEASGKGKGAYDRNKVFDTYDEEAVTMAENIFSEKAPA